MQQVSAPNRSNFHFFVTDKVLAAEPARLSVA